MKALQQTLAAYFAPTQRDTSAATRASAASRKAKALLAQHPSIKVEKDRPGGFWVTCSVWDDAPSSDPLLGNQFAADWEEVLECVTAYVDALESLQKKKP